MPKKHRNLMPIIASEDNLRCALVKTSRNKKRTYGYLEFKEYAEANLALIREELLDGGYRIGAYRTFQVYEPKLRQISALDFKDRLVQHALCNVITPIMEPTLLPYTFACRAGYGTHAGVKHVQSMLRKPGASQYLKTDFAQYFPSMPRDVAHALYARKIDCQATLALLEEILPPTGRGIPIGSLISQLTANLVGGVIDRLLHDQLKHRRWARYMDDIVVLDDQPQRLHETFGAIQEAAWARLGMRISHWCVQSVTRGINFLGYRIWPSHKLLRKDSVRRAKRKVHHFLRHQEHDALHRFLPAWLGHARWADSHNLTTWLENRYAITC